jgi:hypothetical protein
MSRRLASISLMGAWLCASGAVLDLAQVAAWARMFTGYARTESVLAAARETFDPAKPCAICRSVSKAREACDRKGPAVPSAGAEKMVLMLERASPLVAQGTDRSWPDPLSPQPTVRAADVPVPPPRGRLV